MDGRPYTSMLGKDGALQDWQRNAQETLARSLDRPTEPQTMPRIRSSAPGSIRPVTPEAKGDGGEEGWGIAGPIHTSPRSIPGGEKPRDRRQGFVFQNSYSTESVDRERGERASHGPPVSFNSRPRTRTVGDHKRDRSTSTSVSKSRHRIGSVHSTASSSYHDVQPAAQPDVSNSLGFPSISTRHAPPQSLQKSNSAKTGRKLVKRTSRPTSPLSAMGDVPSVDSLPFPVATGDANKILMLMKTLCGRMRGEVEYQTVENGPWYSGVCYIDDVKGSLMYEGDDRGPFHLAVIPDLRGCRVKPINSRERPVKCLELTNQQLGIEIHLLPMVKQEYDLWLAALLCWQQIRTGTLPASPPRPTGQPLAERRPGASRRDSSYNGSGVTKGANIIKVAKLLLWDKGAPSSPTAIVRRPSTRDLRSPRSCWRRVSCILQDNGEFKLLTENDITLLSVIQLSQLSRCAIQRLDRSVLDEEYCIAIFPQYTPNSTQLSIFRPVYVALESRLTHEVWFCLLRAFTVPEIYGPQPSDVVDEYDEQGILLENPPLDDMFRIEKSLTLRLIEAKIRRPMPKNETLSFSKSTNNKSEPDPSIGDYFAEVVLDNEIRAKTITKTETRNPFWREDCTFQDLPSHLPRLSIVLKQIEHPAVATHGFLSSSSIHIPAHPTQVICGTIDIPIEKLNRGKDSEAWWPILDDQKEPLGEMFLRIRHDELVVLLAKDYQPISELLHNFGSGLTLLIAQSIPNNLRPLSEIFMNIFQVSGHAGEWLTALVEDEIDGIGKEPPVRRVRWSRRIGSNESSTSEREQNVRDMGKSLQGEANLLFRGNSLLTQALDFHMRRVGKDYLDDVLSERILEINAMNPDCEVDPSRLAPGDDISKNWSLLITLTTDVWKSISGSANRCPPELRQVMKYIRAVAEDRYGDFLRSVTYTSVSGFLFLRFFCPALLNPKLFGLLRDHPQPKAQRTLTLIAKSLQALANLSNFGQKEEWMEPMNRFLSGNRQEVKDFIDNVCSISAERNNFSLPASYSTPITILARLPPTSREGFPSLPYLIDHARNFAALVKLWLDATSNYVASQPMEGDLLKFHELCVGLQRRTDDCLAKAEQNEHNVDQLSLQWEDIVEGLESSTIHDVTSPNPNPVSEPESPSHPVLNIHSLPAWTEYSTHISAGSSNTRTASAGSDAGSKERKDRQSFWDATFGKDSKYQRPYESPELQKPYGVGNGSPPSRGQSRNGKPTKSFLSGLRRKGKDGKEGGGIGIPVAGSYEKDTGSPGSSWTPGGMF